MSPTDDKGAGSSLPLLMFRLYGLVFGGIGVTVLVFLWGSSYDSFGSPPLFFRIFGTFIAIPFVATGVVALFGKLTPGSQALQLLKRMQQRNAAGLSEAPPTSDGPVNYRCPNCAATIGSQAEVSPHGDCRCPHCGKWFNIHRSN